MKEDIVMQKFHYHVIHKNFEGKYNLIYSDTDSLVYNIMLDDIYEWVKDNKQYFDLSESVRDDLKDDTHEKFLGQFKYEIKGLASIEFIALNPNDTRSILYQRIR